MAVEVLSLTSAGRHSDFPKKGTDQSRICIGWQGSFLTSACPFKRRLCSICGERFWCDHDQRLHEAAWELSNG